MEALWNSYLEKHFPDERWQNYYHTIMYYTMAVNFGLKPAFMWDFGPRPTNADQVTTFIEDLKINNIISQDIVVVLLRFRVLVANVPCLLDTLQQNTLVIDISERNEAGWFLTYRNEFVLTVCDCITDNIMAENYSSGRLHFDFRCHFPTVYGLMLGYPFTYYTEHKYPPISFYLRNYRVICRFRFGHTTENFPIYEFNIPKSLVTSIVRSSVNLWFEKLQSRNTTGFELVLEQWDEYYDPPSYTIRFVRVSAGSTLSSFIPMYSDSFGIPIQNPKHFQCCC